MFSRESGSLRSLSVVAMVLGIDNLKDLLEVCAYGTAIIASVAGAVLFLARKRNQSIETTRKNLARTWTNEGDILVEETHFVHLCLEDEDGDIIGRLESSGLERPLEVQCQVGWWSTKLNISELRGRSLVTVASIKLRITGNNNRLRWRQVTTTPCPDLPFSTTLWPSRSTGVFI
jgi:hypothetical protein